MGTRLLLGGMRRPRSSTATLLMGSLLLAAPTPGAAQGTPEPRHLGHEFPVYEAPEDPSAPALPATLPGPSGTLTLKQALREAVARSPALAAFSWELRARDAELLQARAFPNPELGTEIEDFAGSGERRGFHGSQTTLSFAQLFELGGKRSRRMRLASLERDLSAWDYEAARLSVLTDTTKAFVATLGLQERIALAAELLKVAEESERTVRATVRAGATSPVEASRAAVAVQEAAITLAKLDRELAATRAVLASSWGAGSVAFDRVTGDLGSISPPPAFDMLAQALSENPDLARWSTELAQRKAAVAFERAQRIPDVAIGVGPRYYADDRSAGMVAGFTVPLPLLDRNRGGILQAEYRLKRAANEQAAALVGAQAQLQVAYQALAAAHAEVEVLRQRALPQADAAYSGAMEAYQTGLFRYVEVLDAQRTLFELKTEEIAALVSYHDAVADLERLTGTPLSPFSSAP